MSVRPLTHALAEVARKELNEDPKLIEESLSRIKDWMAKEPHLNARQDDQWLMAFLRGCKFSLERTKEKIDLYYSLRSTAPDLFCLKHSDPKTMELINLGVGLILHKPISEKGPRVIIYRPGKYDPDIYNAMEVVSVGAMINQICYMEDDNLTVSGTVNIMDMEGTKFSHFTQMTPWMMKQIITLNQEAAPNRMKGVHFINTPPFFETAFNFAKTFCTEKNRNRLHVHNKNYEELYKYVSKDILPIEYGGYEYSVQDIIDYWAKKFKTYEAWHEKDIEYGTVESKRSGKQSLAASMFGVEGSFRQLQLD